MNTTILKSRRSMSIDRRTTFHSLRDDERREPMGLTLTETCRRCRGPILRTSTAGLCWSCMPTA
ncbi:MAG: hypothetical protein WAO50_12310 [Candidatus Nanopelagicales bacterium]